MIRTQSSVMMAKVILPFMVALAPIHGAFAQVYVQNYLDFQKHIQLHRERVVKLGIGLAEAEFPELDVKKVEAYLKLHDFSKTNVPKVKLEKAGYFKYMPPSYYLYEYYGLAERTRQQEADLKELVNTINRIDQMAGEEFFSEQKEIQVTEIEKLKKIEKVADLVDRSLDPVAAEEFGRKMTPASQFLKDPELVNHASFLESKYHRYVRGLVFPKINRCSPVFL